MPTLLNPPVGSRRCTGWSRSSMTACSPIRSCNLSSAPDNPATSTTSTPSPPKSFLWPGSVHPRTGFARNWFDPILASVLYQLLPQTPTEPPTPMKDHHP
jgi:hypothetical protein